MSRRVQRREGRALVDKRRRVLLLGGLSLAALAIVAVVAVRLSKAPKPGEVALFTSPAQVARVSPTVAKARVDRGDAVLYDVRARTAYDASHAAGALALPEDELDSLFSSLPADKDLILY